MAESEALTLNLIDGCHSVAFRANTELDRNPFRPGMGLEPAYLADRQCQRFTRYLNGFSEFPSNVRTAATWRSHSMSSSTSTVSKHGSRNDQLSPPRDAFPSTMSRRCLSPFEIRELASDDADLNEVPRFVFESQRCGGAARQLRANPPLRATRL